MVEGSTEAFTACFEKLEDSRSGNAGRHDLLEILMIAVCAVLCGGQTAMDMAEFGEVKEDSISRLLKLEHGIPSHDTFDRVFRFLGAEQFRAGFITFMVRFSGEDQACNRKDNGPENLAVPHHIALNIVCNEKPEGSVRIKFKRAGWNNQILDNLLTQI